MRLVHLSDIHVWRYNWDPRRWAGRRLPVMLDLLRGRARRFRLERVAAVVERARSLEPDHVLVTGDLTTTALPGEFEDARRALAPLLERPGGATMVPGNHDRTTGRSLRSRRFERAFADCLPAPSFPWLRRLDDSTAIIGLDPTRARISARGYLPPGQLAAARRLIDDVDRPTRYVVACHYPLVAPPAYAAELRAKRLENPDEARAWLATFGPHLFCCGHVHAAWAYRPPELPDQLCLNAGAPLMSDPTGRRLPGFLEIELDGPGVRVIHHAWDGTDWTRVPLSDEPAFFAHAGRTVPAPNAR